jgi:hypothetical protein
MLMDVSVGWVDGHHRWICLLTLLSEVEKEFDVPEQAVKTRPIEAQNGAIPRGIASICNDERACFGGLSGHGGFLLNLSE